MTCAQIKSTYIKNFKNVIKNSKWYPVSIAINQNPLKRAKDVFTPAKISQFLKGLSNQWLVSRWRVYILTVLKMS